MKMNLFLGFLLAVISYTLHSKECSLSSPVETFKPQLAKHFFIEYFINYKIIHVDDDQYVLMQKSSLGCKTSLPIIKSPVQKVVMMSTTYLPALVNIDKSKSLIGFPGIKSIYSSSFDLNTIEDVSYLFNPEELLRINADLIMGYEANFSNVNQRKLFKKLDLPVVVNKDFEENSPLARAEWMIFIASFFNEEEKARKEFNNYAAAYRDIKRANDEMAVKPKVLVGDIQNGYWVTPGGQSDFAQLIIDAGAEMLFSKPGNQTKKISLEELSKLKTPIDFWLPQNMWSSTEELEKALRKDSRYSLVKTKNIYNNNLRLNKNKSNDYWETGMQRPDLLLRDLSAIFHPSTYKTHEFNWYQKL